MRKPINKVPTAKDDYIVCMIMILVEVILVYITYTLFKYAMEYNDVTNWNYGFLIGAAMSFLFQLSYYVAGGLKNAIGVVVSRWSDFCSNMKFSFSFAITSLFESLKEEGIALLCYIVVSLVTLNIGVHGFMYFFDLYGITL